MDFLIVVNSIITLFILMAVGYASYKAKIIDRTGAGGLSSFLVNISLPCLIIISMQIPLDEEIFGNTMNIFIIAAVFYAISFAFAIIVPRYLVRSDLERGVYRFMLVFSNLGFMGIPVSMAMFGEEAAFYASLFMLPFGLLVFSAGILMLRPDMGRFCEPKIFLNPGIVASLLGLLFFFSGYRIPDPFFSIIDILGSMTTPLAMVVVGALLAAMPVSEMFTDSKIYIMSAFRLLVIPLALYIVIRPFVNDPLILGVPVILAAMPVAANAVLLAEEYSVDSNAASKGVFISTILCVITIPLIGILLL
ncbi:MAG: AEC family transporter [Methanomicrobium sp.]|nr:AEC family transporter [Methanomicrobium sp.]MDD4299899.1 AEC family transporter [Methanomicrobium sp.]